MRPRSLRIAIVTVALIGTLAATGRQATLAQEPINAAADTTADTEEQPAPTSIAVTDVVDDEAIGERLRGILSTRARYDQLELSVNQGIVTVRGKVESQEDIDWVKRLAERTEGVILVDNQAAVIGTVDFTGNLRVIQASLATLWKDFLRRLPLLIAGIGVLITTALMAKLVAWALTQVLSRRTRLRTSLKDLVFQLTTIATWIAGLMITAVVVFPGMTPSRALTLLGVGSVAIGFAFKDIFENFFAGILILWRYPFDRGDFITNQDLTGCVEEITIRNTLIRKLDGELTVVPNAQLFTSSVDVLTSRAHRRVQLICGIAYGEQVDAARNVIASAVRSCDSVYAPRGVQVYAQEFADSSINMEVTWWTGSRPQEIRSSRDQVVSAIKRELDAAGIEIPFPYRTLTFKQSSPLSLAPELVKPSAISETTTES